LRTFVEPMLMNGPTCSPKLRRLAVIALRLAILLPPG
jgi:hypothetical protein